MRELYLPGPLTISGEQSRAFPPQALLRGVKSPPEDAGVGIVGLGCQLPSPSGSCLLGGTTCLPRCWDRSENTILGHHCSSPPADLPGTGIIATAKEERLLRIFRDNQVMDIIGSLAGKTFLIKRQGRLENASGLSAALSLEPLNGQPKICRRVQPKE